MQPLLHEDYTIYNAVIHKMISKIEVLVFS